MGFNSQDISVDEIYDFIQDLKLDVNSRVPEVDRMEISFCFNILNRWEYVIQNKKFLFS
jgi:hypothetical protein